VLRLLVEGREELEGGELVGARRLQIPVRAQLVNIGCCDRS
jgi:hypothetical protein